MRGRPRKPLHLHLLQGTYRGDRHARRRAEEGAPQQGSSWPAELSLRAAEDRHSSGSGPGQALTPGQVALLKLRPKGLSWHEARHYRELVVEAPWLEPIDRPLLLAYLTAWSTYETAGKGLDRLLKDLAFADPRSEVSKQGLLYNRIVHRKASLLMQLAHTLGFSPAGRRALGVE